MSWAAARLYLYAAAVFVCAVLYARMVPEVDAVVGPTGKPPGAARSAHVNLSEQAAGCRRRARAPNEPPFVTHVFFGPWQDVTTPDVLARIARWWASLPPEVQAPLRGGGIGIVIVGHADPTGAEAANRALSHRRAVLVEGVVRALLRGTPRIDTRAWGAQKAREAGAPAGVADPRWRRVTVTLDTPGGAVM